MLSAVGFKVTFGRYSGVKGQIGFDGHWESPTGFHIVTEVKTSEVFPIKTATLVGYVNELIGEKKVPDWDAALGLYVVGKPDPEVQQLENAILAEKRTQQMRIISAESLLSLAELMNSGYDVEHTDVLALLRPASPTIDPVINLIAQLVAQQASGLVTATEPQLPDASEELPESASLPSDEVTYWLTPVKSDKQQAAEVVINVLVGQEKVYAFAENTPGRKRLKVGDRMCFYAASKGVVAHAKVVSLPKKQPHFAVRDSEKYPWVFAVDESTLYLDEPIAIDGNIRNQLDAFKGKDTNNSWGWFVQATRTLTKHDFEVLTGLRAKDQAGLTIVDR